MSINNPTLDELLSSPIGSKWSTSNSRTSFTQEIQQMMYGFGDYEKPLYESAQLIEHIVHQQMTSLLCEANGVAQTRGSRFIGVEEILFLMRFDRQKLSRLVKYLSVKDVKSFLKAGTVEEEDVLDTINTNSDDKNTSACDAIVSTNDDMTSKPPQQTKRVKLCYDFLSSIDSSGALLVVFDENFVDTVRHERNVRTDRMAKTMSETNYYKYSESRQMSFANKTRPSKFRDWILKDSVLEIKPNLLALEVLQYLAKETVSQIVDLSLLVKQDLERDVCDPLTALLPHKMVNQDFPINHSIQSQQSSDSEELINANSSQSSPFFVCSQSSKSVQKNPLINPIIESQKSKKRKRSDHHLRLSFEAHSYCITPNHIREAMRRYFTASGPFVKSHKSTNQTPIHNKKLLCL